MIFDDSLKDEACRAGAFAADAVLLWGEVAADASSIPGAGAVFKIIGEIKAAREKSKANLKCTQELSMTCTTLVEHFEAHRKRLDGTGMDPPLTETVTALSDARDVINKYATYSTVKAWWYRNKIQDDLHKSTRKINDTIRDFKLESMLQTQHQLIVIEHGVNETIQILQRDRDQVKHMSTEEGKTKATTAYQIINKMRTEKDRPDSELRIGGAQVTRAQYNLVYLDLIEYLDDIQRHTGQRPQVVELGDNVVLESSAVPERGGTYTQVYHGNYLGQPVAVKTLRGVKYDFERARKRLLTEFEIWPELKHPHIQAFIGITNVRTKHDAIAVVSPWQEKGNIVEYTRNCLKADRLHLLAGAAAGLKYLHCDKSIVHGCLKGSNILVTDKGEAVITDFSMSKVMKDLESETGIRSADSMTKRAGARWSAFEVAVDGKDPTFKSDIWSMAMVIVEVATGEEPFRPQIRAEYQVIVQLMHGKRPERPVATTWVPDALWELMQQCWREEPNDRPDVDDVLARLHEAEAARALAESQKPMIDNLI